MPDKAPAPPEPRAARIGRYALAGVLGASLLAMTLVLFDDDLGTPAPLFQEFTCLPRGALTLEVDNASGGTTLRVPQSGLRVRALGEGELRPAYFQLYKREAPGEWTTYFELAIESGENFFVIAPTTNATEVYVVARDLEGKYCRAESSIITAVEGSARSTP